MSAFFMQSSIHFPEEPKIRITITTEKPTQFALNLLIPSWATEKTQILINGEKIKTVIKPVSFVTIDRTWKMGDNIELLFDYRFHLKTMPDNENVVALFYGPVLLAFETGKELILKGNQEAILQNITKNDNEFSFSLNNNNQLFLLRPLYEITNQSYGVYATIRNEY